MRHWKWSVVVSVVLLVGILSLSATAVNAFQVRGGDRVIIDADEVVEDDLYVTAGEVVVAGTIRGDLVAVGGTVEVKGVVDGDLLAAAQSVIIDGQVTDDARVSGAAIRITEQGQVGDDLVGAGYSLAIRPSGAVNGDVVFGGAQALLEGEVAGDVRAGVNALEVRGSVNGELLADVGASGQAMGPSPFMFMPNAPSVPSVPGGLTVGEDAELGSTVVYTATEQGAIAEEAVTGEVTFNEVTPSRQRRTRTPMGRFLGYVRRFVGLLLFGLLMIWLVPQHLGRLADAVKEKPLPSLGWGALTYVGVGVAFFVLLLITGLLAALFGVITLNNVLGTVIIVGLLTVFALAVAFGLVTSYIAKIIVSFGGGRWLLTRLNPAWGKSKIAALVFGLLIFILLTLIPWVGGVFKWAIILLGMGALWLQVMPYLRRSSKETVG